jgi:hypothetical protein
MLSSSSVLAVPFFVVITRCFSDACDVMTMTQLCFSASLFFHHGRKTSHQTSYHPRTSYNQYW